MLWHSVKISEILKKFGVKSDAGLTAAASMRAMKKYGKNEFTEAPGDSVLKMIWHHTQNIPTMILIFAAFLSLAMEFFIGGGMMKFIVISSIVILNVTLAVTQERGAERALAALRKLSSPTNVVIRGGRRMEIDSSELVPGDIVLLKTGDMISADARIIDATDFNVDEAALTGESVPVNKNPNDKMSKDALMQDQTNMVFRGTLVTAGRATVIVVATGMQTQMGRIAELLNDAQKLQTPLQVRINRMGRAISMVALVAAVAILVVGFMRGGMDVWNLAFLAIALAVAAVPEMLPLIVTLTLAHAVQQMVKKSALIRKLPAVETLGSTSVICSDKTGTLTLGQMEIKRLWMPGADAFTDDDKFSAAQMQFIRDYALTTEAIDELDADGTIRVIGNPTESAILKLLNKKGEMRMALDKKYPRAGEIMFTAARKIATTVRKIPGGYIVITCGAIDKIPFAKKLSKGDMKIHDEFASDALRMLALGSKIIKKLPPKNKWCELESDLEFRGIVGLIDPPRPESAQSIALARAAGIRTVMITGDHKMTAGVIARDIGILDPRCGECVITGAELSKMSDAELQSTVMNYSVYARVSPEDKIRIVKAWQSRDAVVAMTGDGVNDAPALKAADVGVAMGITGTEVSKSAADMVLTDDNYASIVHAVRWGRGVFSNIKKTVNYLLTCNFSEIILILGAKIMGWGMPLTPIMILLINVVCDGIPGIALSREKPDPDIMNNAPVKRGISLFYGNRAMMVIQVAAFVVVGFIAYYIGKFVLIADTHLPSHIMGQTMAFVVIGWTSIWHIFNVRTTRSVFRTPLFENPLLTWGALFTTVLVVLFVVVPPMANIFGMVALSGTHWWIALVLSIIPTFTAEAYKLCKK